MAYTHPANSDSSEDSYNSDADASTLKQHAEITADPKRHQAAHAKLAEQTQQHSSALDASHKQLRSKVKKGLKQAFPSGLDKPTPFEGAKSSGGTPYDEAGSK